MVALLVALAAGCGGSDGNTAVLPTEVTPPASDPTTPESSSPDPTDAPTSSPTDATSATTKATSATTTATSPATTKPSGASPAERVGGVLTVPNARCIDFEPGAPPRVVVNTDDDGSVDTNRVVRFCVFGFTDEPAVALTVLDAAGAQRFVAIANPASQSATWYTGTAAPLGDYTVRAVQGKKTAAASFRLVLPPDVRVVTTSGDDRVSAKRGTTVAVHVHGPVGSTAILVMGGPVPSNGDAPIAVRKTVTLTTGRAAAGLVLPADAAAGGWCVAVAGADVVARCRLIVTVPK
jgi:hypothetical protein